MAKEGTKKIEKKINTGKKEIPPSENPKSMVDKSLVDTATEEINAEKPVKPEEKSISVYKNATISPQKARLIANVIRGKKAQEARVILDLMHKKGAKLMKKVLVAAIAGAEHDHNMDKDALYVSRILVDDGIKFRRYRAVARGRGHGFVRRRSHILVELSKKA